MLENNCRENFGEWTCVIGNICGYCSMVIWLLVLFPQIYKNHVRRSTEGLSILWALFNFTASFFNVFFVYRLHLPLFYRVSAVYMPLLEATILIQFIAYRPLKSIPTHVFVLYFLFLVVWIVSLFLLLLFPSSTTPIFEWIAITLWSIETMPQIYLNFSLHSTEGQSKLSMLITVFGKTTDFGSAYLLTMPLQTAVLAFYSSSQAFANAAQIVLFEILSRREKIEREDLLLKSSSSSSRRREKNQLKNHSFQMFSLNDSGFAGEDLRIEEKHEEKNIEKDKEKEEEEEDYHHHHHHHPDHPYQHHSLISDPSLPGLFVALFLLSLSIVGMSVAFIIRVLSMENVLTSWMAFVCPFSFFFALFLGWFCFGRSKSSFHSKM